MTKTLLGIACVISLSSVASADPVRTDDGAADLQLPSDGWRYNVTLGAATFPSASMDVGTGVSAGALIGRESMHGQAAVLLGVELETQSFGHITTSSGDVNTYAARPTVRVSYYANHWMPYAELGVGYLRASESATVGGMHVEGSDNMLALEAAGGLSYRLTDRYALGVYVRYEPDFEPALNQFVDVGAAFTVLH